MISILRINNSQAEVYYSPTLDGTHHCPNMHQLASLAIDTTD